MAITSSYSTLSVTRQRAISRYHATRAIVLVYLGYNVRALSLTCRGGGAIPGSSEPVNNRYVPTFTGANGCSWGIEERLVSFDAAVRMAEYAGRMAMGTYAPTGLAPIAGLSGVERARADEELARRDEYITTLARALYQAHQLDHDRVIDLISPLRSRKPRS